jgi:hypothetical protein
MLKVTSNETMAMPAQKRPVVQHRLEMRAGEDGRNIERDEADQVGGVVRWVSR